jgi:riboflavin biosynthesis pyrimidine reductase
MDTRLVRLYPGPPQETALAGTYLAHSLHLLGTPAAPFVYADFVFSLDGRIALQDPTTGGVRLPEELRSESDFRLLLELEAQADCLVTNSGYLRAVAAGRLDDILEISRPDLVDWRRENGLPPQPDVVIVSSSLDFPIPASLAHRRQRVFVATGASTPRDEIDPLRARGFDLIIAGTGGYVEGAALTSALSGLGFRSIFLLAGPRLLETMLRGGVLSRLYATIVHRILGGEGSQSLVSGLEFGPAGRLCLSSLYHDATGPDGIGQWFAQFEIDHTP